MSKKRKKKEQKPSAVKSAPGNGHKKLSPEEDVKKGVPLSLRESEFLYYATLISPLVFGAWVASDNQSANLVTFLLLFALWAAAFHLAVTIMLAEKTLMKSVRRDLLSFLVLICLFLFYSRTESGWATLLAALLAALTVLNTLLELKTPRSVIGLLLGVNAQMALFSVLGVYSQIQELRFNWAILGLVPGGLLASRIVAERAVVFEQQGWRRFFEKTKKNGKVVKRPGGLATLFSMPLFLGPALAFVLPVLGFIPDTFALAGVGIFFVADLAAAFMEKKIPDALIAKKVTRIAGLTSVACLAAALLIGFL